MEGGEGVDVLADGGEGGGVEDCEVVELGYQEGIGGWGGLD